jgi:hypothetical protein
VKDAGDELAQKLFPVPPAPFGLMHVFSLLLTPQPGTLVAVYHCGFAGQMPAGFGVQAEASCVTSSSTVPSQL